MTSQEHVINQLSIQQQCQYLMAKKNNLEFANNSAKIVLKEELKEESFVEAIKNLCDKQEILRTVLQPKEGFTIPVQCISQEPNLLLIVDDKEIDIGGHVSRATYDSANNIRVEALSRTGETEILITLPSLLADKHSLFLISEQLVDFYKGNREVGEIVQYVDYAKWSSEVIADSKIGESGCHWLEELGDLDSSQYLQKIAVNNCIPALGDFKQKQVAITPELSKLLSDSSDVSNTESILFSAWGLLLSNWNQVDTTVVGYLSPCREVEQVQKTIGAFEKILPIKLPVKSVNAGSYLSSTNDILTVGRSLENSLDYSMIFNSELVSSSFLPYQFEYDHYGYDQSKLNIEVLSKSESPFSLKLCVERVNGELKLDIKYDGQYLDEEVDILAERYLLIISQMLSKPDEDLENLNIYGPKEREILTSFEQDISDAGIESVYASIAKNANEAPENIAVKVGDKVFTYGELWGASENFAALLKDRGVNSNDRVGVILDRSEQPLVAMIAIWGLGAIVVPMDKVTPSIRVKFVVEQLGIKHLVCENEDYADLQCNVICNVTSGIGEKNHLPTEIDINKTALILHTSGSTGTPNSVPVTHQSIANYIFWAQKTYAINDNCDSVWLTSSAFDLSITSYLLPLVCKSFVHVIEGCEVIKSLGELLIASETSLVIKMTPSHALALIEDLKARNVKIDTNHVFVLGGEVLADNVVQGLNNIFHDLTIFNEYGPTETTVGCSYYKLEKSCDTRNIPIGQPIDNTNIKILGKENEELPVGSIGQIAISGLGVAAGYINNEEANASKFLNVNGVRTYLTGDQGRIRANGVLEFIGRSDAQINLRGFRIELGEIENNLNSIDEIDVSAVVLGRTKNGRNLVAYYKTKEAANTASTDVRKVLESNLPPYMVPDSIVKLNTFPMTENGKIDRKALSNSFIGSNNEAQIYVAPRNQTEEILAAVWMNVFEAEKIGIDDNYFELGGDSVRSVQVTALAETRGLRFKIQLLHENPTIRTLSVAIHENKEDIEVHQTQPFELLSQEDRALIADDIEDAYPLNLLQEGMIYHRDFAPKSAVYHAICSYNINMPVDVSVMKKSVTDLVQQHPLLRTSFDLSTFSGPTQLVHKEGGSPLGYLDLRNVDSSEHQKYVDEWMEEEKVRGFEIEEYPLIRFMLHQFTDDHCQLSYSFHHEIIDGWSDALMMTELMNRYLSSVNNVDMEFPLPSSTFRDAVYLEQQALKNDEFKEFWLDRMADTNVMKLPNKNKPKADKGEREIIKFEPPINKELSDAVKQLSNTLAVPLKTVLLAAHLKVMSLMGGHKDVMTYTVGNGRPENRDGHATVGLFVNSLAFRQELGGGSWANLVRDTLKTENELLPYRRYPMAELKRQHGSEPLAETLFFFNHYHITDGLTRWDNAVLNEIKVYAESTFPFCVNAFLTPFEKDICIRIEYDALQYRDDDMQVAGQFYIDVLRKMVEDPYANYNELDFLPSKMSERIASDMSRGESLETPEESILYTISKYEKSEAGNLAVVDPSSSLTYAELEKYSNGIANYLLNTLEHESQYVAICMNRSMELIPTILGVLKAGKAYVPINPENPNARIEAIVEELGASIICDSGNSGRFVNSNINCVNLAELRDELRVYPGDEPNVEISLDSTAYVIYTSGTTGKPKGVSVNHRSLAASTNARLKYYELQSSERHVLVSSSSFDSSIAVIFGALASGASLLVSDDETLKDGSALLGFMKEHKATSLLSVPSLLATLLDEDMSQVTTLVRVISAGEALARDLAAKIISKLKVELFNEYGPTEATVWSTVYKVGSEPQLANVPIGRPIPGAQIVILDNNMHQVPVGVQGEIYIGGLGLSQGYINDCDLTKERFVDNHFSNEPKSLLYRTGDIARFNHDGDIEYIGRTDKLVKVQGFRVELTEVEAVLNDHDSVEKSIAVVSEDGVGQKYLCAYVLPPENFKGTVDVSELKEHTKKVLPKYMVPSVVIVMNQLPLTSSGKLDYDHLPNPGRFLIERSTTYVAPTTETEKVIESVWCSILNSERIGVHDDFTELGGESLAAMKIMAQVRKIYSVNISLGEVFDDVTTIAKVATKIDMLLNEAKNEDALEEVEVGEF